MSFSFALSVTTRIYYRTRNQIFRIFEGPRWVELSQEQLQAELARCKETGEKYMMVYDYMIMSKCDKWDASPSSITRDELDFWALYGLLSEEQYLHYINLMHADTEG
ncbi:hypothetical protein J2T17_007651 [Paenibacillus mucilaginosus]|uniref:hypothetical protein n=1 Tax=Paenibacillus mucilaginosus TaxID=61624 RepID=UPI003D1BED01